MKTNTLRKKKSGIGYVEYKSKNLNFTIFQPPGSSGHVEVLDKNMQVFCSESGSHRDRINEMVKLSTLLKRRAKILDYAVKIMKEHKYDIPR